MQNHEVPVQMCVEWMIPQITEKKKLTNRAHQFHVK